MNEHRFVEGVRTFAYGAESIEGRNTERGGKVAVGAAASGGLTQLPSHSLCQLAGGGKPGSNLRGTLHWWPINASADVKPAAAIVRLQAAELFFNKFGIGQLLDAHIHLNFRLSRNHIA